MLFRLSLTASRLGLFDPEPELLQATRAQLIDDGSAVFKVYGICMYSPSPHFGNSCRYECSTERLQLSFPLRQGFGGSSEALA